MTHKCSAPTAYKQTLDGMYVAHKRVSGIPEVRRIPYHESTMVVDIIDARTNLMVWRGYYTETIDFEKSEKTIHKSIEKLTRPFAKYVAKQKKR